MLVSLPVHIFSEAVFLGALCPPTIIWIDLFLGILLSWVFFFLNILFIIILRVLLPHPFESPIFWKYICQNTPTDMVLG